MGLFETLFENEPCKEKINSFHLKQVEYFDKNKLNKKKQFGRAYQLGRVGGNFLIVSECTSIRMPDAKSFPDMLQTHETCFGKEVLKSVATDKGYYSLSNHLLLEAKGIEEIGLQRPDRDFNAPRNKTSAEVQKALYRRRAGIEALIGHLKQSWQMGRSRMKSDQTTLSAGYASVLGFNLRQLMRYASGQVRPLDDKKLENEQNSPE